MPKIQLDGRNYTLNQGETVLDCLLRNDVRVTYSCKSGVCRSCVMRATSGAVPAVAQAGLKDSWKARGYFMACACVPDEDLHVVAPDDEMRFAATISSLQLLSGDVMQVSLSVESALQFRAGQYVTVVRSDGLARSYSIASLPEDGEIHLHVRRIARGRMSSWFHTEARAGDRVTLLGPSGECFYVPGREDQPLLLAGTGTGLAPLYGIVRDSIRHGHRGLIRLFHGAVHPGGLYLVQELRALSQRHPQFEYTPAVLNNDGQAPVVVGALDSIIAERVPNPAGWRAFVCGDPNIVSHLRKKLFLAGMASRDIYADAFIPAAGSSLQ